MHLPSIRFGTSLGVRDFGPYHNNTERRKSKAVVRVHNNQKSASIQRMRCEIWFRSSALQSCQCHLAWGCVARDHKSTWCCVWDHALNFNPWCSFQMFHLFVFVAVWHSQRRVWWRSTFRMIRYRLELFPWLLLDTTHAHGKWQLCYLGVQNDGKL